MAVLMGANFITIVHAGPCYGGGWGGYRGGYYGGGCWGGGWGVPLAIGAGVGLLGAAAAYNYAAYAAPVYAGPVYPTYYYQGPPQAVVVQQSQQESRRAPSTPPSGALAKAQSKLAGLGYYQGPVDGSYGPKTAQAVQQFQADNNLPVSGRLDLKTLSSLGISL